MSSPSPLQRNGYKGTPPRCWVRLRFKTAEGIQHERELLADTGSPCPIILGSFDLSLLSHAPAQGIESNFGHLNGGWLELDMAELGLSNQVLGYGSDEVFRAVRGASGSFSGLAGLPLLRRLEYGGDAE